MKAFIIFLIFTIGIISCEKPYIEKPDSLLSQSEMETILADIYLTQQMVNMTSSSSTNYILEHAKNSKFAIEKYNTDVKTFEESYKYYFAQPDVYQKILDNVKAKLYEQYSEEEKKRIEALQ